jgi:hypothetical protein
VNSKIFRTLEILQKCLLQGELILSLSSNYKLILRNLLVAIILCAILLVTLFTVGSNMTLRGKLEMKSDFTIFHLGSSSLQERDSFGKILFQFQ